MHFYLSMFSYVAVAADSRKARRDEQTKVLASQSVDDLGRKPRLSLKQSIRNLFSKRR